MQCPKCSSPNIEQLSHYWKSLPAESPLKAAYAPPAETPSQVWLALLAVIGGIAIAISGSPGPAPTLIRHDISPESLFQRTSRRQCGSWEV